MIYRINKLFPVIPALLLAMGFASCISENLTDGQGSDGNPIVFTPATRAANRAATGSLIESGANIPSGGSFGVYAYSRLSTMSATEAYAPLQNREVTSGGTTFSYAPVANWPVQSGAQLSFYGYYPWRDQSVPPGAGEPVIDVAVGAAASPSMTIDYATPGDPSKQVDLMYASHGLTTGYDPVEMVFGHALTRINFTARKEDYTSAVGITKITLRNVLTKGTLTVIDATPPVWSGLSSAADMTLTPSNGLQTGVMLTGMPTSVINAGDDMLVIPQGVGGIVVEVEATNGGEAFPEPFVFPLDGSPDWLMNRIVTYEITLAPDGIRIEAKVTDWNNDYVSIIFDRQHHLSVSDDELVFWAAGNTIRFTAETDYDTASQGYPAGIYIETEYDDGAGGWLTLSDVAGGDGDLSRTINFTATQNSSGFRTARIKVRAGNLTKVVYVSQPAVG